MERLHVGDRVLVRLGADESEARVLEIYGPGDSQVLLAVPILGAGGEVLDEQTVSLPAHRVRRVAVA